MEGATYVHKYGGRGSDGKRRGKMRRICFVKKRLDEVMYENAMTPLLSYIDLSLQYQVQEKRNNPEIKVPKAADIAPRGKDWKKEAKPVQAPSSTIPRDG